MAKKAAAKSKPDINRPAAKFLPCQWLLGLLLMLAVIFTYQPVWHAGFIWDDDAYVTQNQTLHDLNGLQRIWFDTTATPQYYPLVHTSFWLEYHLWGLNPFGFHLVNVLLHALAAILFWRVLTFLKVPGAWLAAAIFALHPVEVESVAWITERKNVLSAVCFFAAALAYLRFTELSDTADSKRRRGYYYLTALALFIAALLSKTVTCSLPAALLLVRWWKKGQLRWSDVLPLLPFFIVGVSFGLLTAWVEKHHVGAHGAEWSLTLAQRLLIAGRAFWFYAGKLVWPVNLMFNYPRWNIETGVWWQWLFPAMAVVVVVELWLARQRLGRGALVAVLFFAGTLVPALGFINVYPMRYSFVADHFQYLASVGLIVLAAAVITIALNKLSKTKSLLKPIGCGALLLTLGVLSWRQSSTYADAETLWRTTIEKNPGSWLACNNLGVVLLQQGQKDEAVSCWQKSLQIKPDNVEADDDLGAVLIQEGQTDGAILFFQKALEVKPDDAKACNNLGYIYAQRKNFSEAIKYYCRAIQSEPDMVSAYFNSGIAFASMEKWSQAIQSYRDALQIDPHHVPVHTYLAIALQHEGKRDEAIQEYQTALRLNPDDSTAMQQLQELK